MRTGKVGAKKVFWYKHPLIFGIILTIFIPVLIIYISKISWLIGVNFLNSDWLGFWGSYFGASVVCGKINVHTIAAQKYITPQAA